MESIVINVTEKHIQDGRDGILYLTEEKKYCPIALAIHEQLFKGTYKVVNVREYKRKKILFGGIYQTSYCTVGEVIQLNCRALPEKYGSFHPPIRIDHTKESKRFVIDFDLNKPVKAFSFKLKLPKK